MPTFSRHATVDWKGTLMEGGGELNAGTGAFTLPVSFPNRIGDPHGGTSPEELFAAAHATCYAMVVASALGKAGASTRETRVTCTVSADKSDAGIKIMTSRLEVVAEGLTAYFTAEENTEIARRIYDDLLPGGSYICDIPWSVGMSNAQNATRFFSRQAGTFKGILPDEESMRQVMLKAGYREVTVYHPEVLAKEIKLPTPTLEFSLFVVATK